MAANVPQMDFAVDVNREGDRTLERLGDFEKARCQPAPDEVKAEIDQTLTNAFPEPKG